MRHQKLIIHIPHSSTHIPDKTGYVVGDDVLNSEILKLADWYTNELFYNESDIIIKAPFSRVFCDVERFVDDEQEVMAKFGMGVLYENLNDGKLLRKVTPEFKAEVIERYYNAHHQSLLTAVDHRLDETRDCIIIDAHSFPNIPLKRDLNQNIPRPDICIGTNTFHTPFELTAESKAFFEDVGYSVNIDMPYSGTIVPFKHYQKNKNVKSIMIEINRNLYLQDQTSIKSSQFNVIKNLVQNYLDFIRKLKLEV